MVEVTAIARPRQSDGEVPTPAASWDPLIRPLALGCFLLALIYNSAALGGIPGVVLPNSLPLLIGIAAFTVMTTWQRGREVVTEVRDEMEGSLRKFVRDIKDRRTVLPRVPGTAIFLGRAEGQAWFAQDAALMPDLQVAQWVDLRRAAAHWPEAAASAFAYARGMLYWQARSRFCGVCGAAVAFDRAGFVGHCGQCGTDHYPRVDPAVIVAVSDGQRLLLGMAERVARDHHHQRH